MSTRNALVVGASNDIAEAIGVQLAALGYPSACGVGSESGSAGPPRR